MSPIWIPVFGIALTGVFGIIGARLNRRGADPENRTVAVAELQAALAEQRIQIDRGREDAAIERAECAARIAELQADVHYLRAEVAELRKATP